MPRPPSSYHLTRACQVVGWCYGLVMALPDAAEIAATVAASIGRDIDRAVAEHITTGTPLPDTKLIRKQLTAQVQAAVTVAMREIDGNVPAQTIDREISTIVNLLMVIVERAFRDARLRRRRVKEAEPDQPRNLLSKVGLVAFAAAVARRAARAPQDSARVRAGTVAPVVKGVRADAARTGVPMPARTDAKIRQIVRTETAKARNRVGVDVAIRNGWAIWVTDGGPCNFECEKFRNRWATPAWAQANLVAHPNCVRQCTPRRMPPGARLSFY